jgi:hypothetical protein
MISEHTLQSLILRHLAYYARRDVYWFAIPNAGRRTGRAGARLRQEGMRRGVADLCFMLPAGKCAWLEMKTENGRLSDEQKGFQARCLRLGHPYAIAKTIDEAIATLKSWDVLK